jgi:RNA polymerase sigma-70 factor (ECF subfamily)
VTDSENELIRRAQTGDPEAFSLLARNYERRIYSLALHYTRDAADAEDLSQDVWLKAYKAIHTFRGEASFYTWLRQIMINSFINYRRATRLRFWERKQASADEDIEHLAFSEEISGATASPSHAHELEDVTHNKILIEKVMQALGELSAQQRLMFLLKHREGMTYEEIAQALGCSTGTVKKSLFRAVAKLRTALGVETASTTYTACAAGENF